MGITLPIVFSHTEILDNAVRQPAPFAQDEGSLGAVALRVVLVDHLIEFIPHRLRHWLQWARQTRKSLLILRGHPFTGQG